LIAVALVLAVRADAMPLHMQHNLPTIFYAPLDDSGISNLDRNLTINGVTVSPSVWCEGQDAGASSWVCDVGGTLSIAGSGTEPTLDVAAPFSDGTKAVSFAGAKYYATADADMGQIGTGDFVIEFVVSYASANAAGTLSSAGWLIEGNGITIDDGPDAAGIYGAACSSRWCHYICFVNRDEASANGAVCYSNAAAGSGVDASAIAGSLVSTPFDIGSRGDGAGALYSGLIALVAVYEQAAWHKSGAAGPSEWASVAKERFAKLNGTWPTMTKGTYAPTFTRSSSAVLAMAATAEQLLSDGDMEAENTNAWSDGDGATLSKQTSSSHGGARLLRATDNNADSWATAYQPFLTVGKTYRTTGWYRSDGVSTPTVWQSGDIGHGTTSTSWQSFDIAFVAGSIYFSLVSIGSSSGFAEFDDVTVTELRTDLHTVGANWPRVACRYDSSDDMQCGYLGEPASTNLALQSEALSVSTTWTHIDDGDTITADAVAAPSGATTADAIVADATDGQHGVSQTITHTAATHTFSAFFKTGAKTWAKLSDSTVTNAYAYFDIGTCAVGTKGAGAATRTAVSFGGGWCRVSIKYEGTAADHTMLAQCAHADTDDTFAGDGASTSCTMWGSQVEATREPSSYIKTTTASVVRNSDALSYVSVPPAVGTINYNVLCTPRSGLEIVKYFLSYGTDATHYISTGTSYSIVPDEVFFNIRDTSHVVEIYTAESIHDNVLTSLRFKYGPAYNAVLIDGVVIGTPDTSATIPTGATLHFGDYAGATPSRCIVSDVQIYKGQTMRTK
jgi:hypothetical protein